MATKLGAISSLQKSRFRPADLLAAVTGCLEAAGRGFAATGRRCCFLPVMRHSIRFGPSGLAGRRREGRATTDMTLTTRLAIAMIALVAIAVFRGRMAELSQPGTGAAAAGPATASRRIHARSRPISNTMRPAQPEMLPAFRSAVALHGLIRARQGGRQPIRSTAVSEKDLARPDRIANLRPNSKPNPPTRCFRIIGFDNEGRELVRVDRGGPNETVRIVSEEELQKRSNRNYFQETARLGPRTNLTFRRSISGAATD